MDIKIALERILSQVMPGYNEGYRDALNHEDLEFNHPPMSDEWISNYNCGRNDAIKEMAKGK